MAYVGKKFQEATVGTEAAFEEKASNTFAQVTKIDVGAVGASKPVTGTALPNSKVGLDIGNLPVWTAVNSNAVAAGSTDAVINLETGVNPITAVAGDIMTFGENGSFPIQWSRVVSATASSVTVSPPLTEAPGAGGSSETLKPSILTSEQGTGGRFFLPVLINEALPAGTNNIGSVSIDGQPLAVEFPAPPVVIPEAPASDTISCTSLTDAVIGDLVTAVNAYLAGSEALFLSVVYYWNGTVNVAVVTEQS